MVEYNILDHVERYAISRQLDTIKAIINDIFAGDGIEGMNDIEWVTLKGIEKQLDDLQNKLNRKSGED